MNHTTDPVPTGSAGTLETSQELKQPKKTQTKAQHPAVPNNVQMQAQNNGQQQHEDRLTLDQQFRDFQTKVDMAILTGQDYVETAPEITAHFNPKGLGGVDYWIYKGVKIVSVGKQEAVDKFIKMPMHVKQGLSLIIEGTHSTHE